MRVSADPTFRLIGSPKRWDRGAALTSTLHWFETELLTHEENLVGLRAVNRELLAQAEMAAAGANGSATASTETIRTRLGQRRWRSETSWTSARMRCTSLGP